MGNCPYHKNRPCRCPYRVNMTMGAYFGEDSIFKKKSYYIGLGAGTMLGLGIMHFLHAKGVMK